MYSYHYASGYMCGGAVLPVPTAVPWTPQYQPSSAATSQDPAIANPILWRAHFPADITAQLVSWGNPEVQITKIDLYMSGSGVHHAGMVDCFNICKQTTLSRKDKTAGLLWQRKGSATPMSPPAHLLCLQAIQQQLHWYVPHHRFVS